MLRRGARFVSGPLTETNLLAFASSTELVHILKFGRIKSFLPTRCLESDPPAEYRHLAGPHKCLSQQPNCVCIRYKSRSDQPVFSKPNPRVTLRLQIIHSRWIKQRNNHENAQAWTARMMPAHCNVPSAKTWALTVFSVPKTASKEVG